MMNLKLCMHILLLLWSVTATLSACDVNMQSYMITSVMQSHIDVLQEMTGSLLYKTQILIG